MALRFLADHCVSKDSTPKGISTLFPLRIHLR
jgi:hypothetical protein